MLAIHPVHRRLAELTAKARRVGGYERLSPREQTEIMYCLEVNANLVHQLDSLKQLAFLAHQMNDMDWLQDLCRRIDELEVKML